jgi:hypothetical protein
MSKKIQQRVDKTISKVLDNLGLGFDAASQSESKWAMVCHYVNLDLKSQGINVVVE